MVTTLQPLNLYLHFFIDLPAILKNLELFDFKCFHEKYDPCMRVEWILYPLYMRVVCIVKPQSD